MGALGSKLRTLSGDQVGFHCPGCDEMHVVRVPPDPHAWGFNGNGDAPTFTPSVLVRGKRRLTDEEHETLMITDEPINLPDTVCHAFVTDGNIQFLGDCTHALAGQTVPLPDHPGNQSE